MCCLVRERKEEVATGTLGRRADYEKRREEWKYPPAVRRFLARLLECPGPDATCRVSLRLPGAALLGVLAMLGHAPGVTLGRAALARMQGMISKTAAVPGN